MRLSFFLVCAGSLINHCYSYPLAYASTAPVAAVARTKNGTYTGVHVPQLSQEIFRGIPFAHAPRFSLAESLTETWSGFRDAIEPGLTCSGFGTNNLLPYLESGEDCLNLNVVRPAGARPGAKLPVLVWIYGGGYRQGSVNDREFNTSFIVQNSVTIKKPVIVVSINYRLSMFGFVYSIEVQSQGITNLGIRDQWKALEWIKENIEGFGGDPDNVSIWGESAGAFSIGFLTMAYGGDNSGLFQKAIAVSGTAFGVGAGNPTTAQTSYDNVANTTGCYYAIDSLQCMRERKSQSPPLNFAAGEIGL
jgi:carboxylesterase type B